jgi:hypothetical protein
MTEADWLAATDPAPMLEFLLDKASERKLRLFGCATVRIIWTQLGEEPPGAVKEAEEYADGLLSKAALRRDRHVMRDKRHELQASGADADSFWAAYWFTETITTLNAYNSVATELRRLSSVEHSFVEPDWLAICDRLRDTVSPFNPVALDPAWRTEAVVALAAGIYADRAFERMPVLADALDDAGCADAEMLSHCRGDGPHVRGCWVVDLLLGKT